nr:PREDICTED: uncharacterized protein LOC108953394 [Musa acuminata subsp. malaccensis]
MIRSRSWCEATDAGMWMSHRCDCTSEEPFVSRKHTHHRQKADEYRTSAKESAADVVTIHPHRCKLKRFDLCSYFTPAEKNESLVEDDKRLVPTGPNPLHNR